MVTLAARADTSRVVADTTTRAITTFSTTRAAKGILVRRALDKRAIRATVTNVALATELLCPVVTASISRNVVADLDTAISDETSLRLARTVARALVVANSALASNTGVPNEALALSTDTVANTTARALGFLVSRVSITKIKVTALVIRKSKDIIVVKAELPAGLGERRATLESRLEEDIQASKNISSADLVSQRPRGTLCHGLCNLSLRLEVNILLELPRESTVTSARSH